MWAYLVSMFGVLLVVLLWVGIQSLARRSNPELPPDCDMLEVGPHCQHCQSRQRCTLLAHQEDPENIEKLKD